jgi:hypothetical protein
MRIGQRSSCSEEWSAGAWLERPGSARDLLDRRVDQRLAAGGGVVDLLGVPVPVADVGVGDRRDGGHVEDLSSGTAGLEGDRPTGQAACSDELDGQAVDEPVERGGLVVAGLVMVGGHGGEGQSNR